MSNYPQNPERASDLTMTLNTTDERQNVGRHLGPMFPPTHPVANAPVGTPVPTVDGFVREFLHELNSNQGVALSRSTVNDQYLALAQTVRNYLGARWLETQRKQRETRPKGVAYLSAEYLLGRQLGNNLLATGLIDIAEEALKQCGLDFAILRAQEVEPGLGNGGLGRLAACFIDSLATMNVPCTAYGIRYEYGIFRQTFVDGQQVEQPDTLAGARLSMGVRPPRACHPGRLRRPHRGIHGRRGGPAVAVDPGLERAGRPLRLHGPRLPQRACQHPAALERRRHQGLRPTDLQQRRLRAGRARPDVRREHHQGALPRGLHAAG